MADELRRRIEAGECLPGTRLPSRPEIMREWGVSDAVAKQAIGVLISEGLAVARPGAGTFVTERPPVRKLVRAWYGRRAGGSPFRASLAEQGREGSWSYRSETTFAPAYVRERLGLGEPEGRRHDVLCTSYVFTSDGRPVMLSTSYEPLDLTRGTDIVVPEEGPHGGRGVFERMLAIGVVIDRWDETVGARPGSIEECDQLQIARGSVVLTITRTYEAGERVVEMAEIVLPADRFLLGYSGPMPLDGLASGLSGAGRGLGENGEK
ncbi:GntR family transcriptional regulator [Nonomuraea sp. K274]|uniref:GntR family transcriptional regulator n=1 Tax=Nonomuraea cypriaca TaxID=1187855 RepID=A0A931AP40_9ACTN|nr:GntR family transcriptional regulator [Nonomuraea cypriaca]